jgi:hypothetical protein
VNRNQSIYRAHYSDWHRVKRRHYIPAIAAGDNEPSAGQPRGHSKQVSLGQVKKGNVDSINKTNTPSATQLLEWMEPVEATPVRTTKSPYESQDTESTDNVLGEGIIDQDDVDSSLNRNPRRSKHTSSAQERHEKIHHKSIPEDKAPITEEQNEKPIRRPGRPKKTLVSNGINEKPIRQPRREKKEPVTKALEGKSVQRVGKSRRTSTAPTVPLEDRTSTTSRVVPPGAPRSAVVEVLQHAYSMSKRGGVAGDTKRVHVVSNELCGR